MATTPPFLVRALWKSLQTATRQVTGPVDVQSHVPPYFLEDVFCIHVQELKNWSPFQVLKQKCMLVPVALQMVSSCAGLLNGWQVLHAVSTCTATVQLPEQSYSAKA